MLIPNKKRERLCHSYFDKSIGKHRVWVYNKNYDQTAELIISPEGEVVIVKGKLKEAK